MNGLTLEEFNDRILRPRTLAGIKAGDFDGVLHHLLFETEIEWDDETLRALVNRARVVTKSGTDGAV